MYARGLTVRDIWAHLREMYDVDVSPDLISRVTDGVLEEPAGWQSRPLDQVYPVIFIDALMVGKMVELARSNLRNIPRP